MIVTIRLSFCVRDRSLFMGGGVKSSWGGGVKKLRMLFWEIWFNESNVLSAKYVSTHHELHYRGDDLFFFSQLGLSALLFFSEIYIYFLAFRVSFCLTASIIRLHMDLWMRGVRLHVYYIYFGQY